VSVTCAALTQHLRIYAPIPEGSNFVDSHLRELLVKATSLFGVEYRSTHTHTRARAHTHTHTHTHVREPLTGISMGFSRIVECLNL
jgi:hypothetical protein